MKHKFLDKYYVGEWNEKGFPQGKGIMLKPEKYVYYGEFNKIPNGVGSVELFQEQIRY